ncbi:MAG: hypothetical protein ABI766_12960 [Gemmatimonadales bacterium]
MRDSRAGLLLVSVLASCATPAPPAPSPVSTLASAESAYAELRDLRDGYEVTTAASLTQTAGGTPLAELARAHDAMRSSVEARLAAVDSSSLGSEDARALGIMRATTARDLTPLAGSPTPAASPADPHPDCDYDAAAIAKTAHDLDSLRARIYACYGWAQHHVIVGDDTLDRLTVLGAIARTENSVERRRLFLALEPVWRSMNTDNGPASPYRRLIALEVARRGSGEPPSVAQARGSGVPPDSLERWLHAILDAWRAAAPDSLIEPWDWYYAAGEESRRLSPLIPANRLEPLNAAVFASLGADVSALRVHYDLAPREGKTPVAYTTFGARPRLRDGQWSPGEPWVFATYREGGLDNLAELLHETGHAVHIAAIHTRPAFADWPDSDPFTEALGDFVALDVAEPAWQQRWLGDSVPLADGLRARYSGIVMDVAWALLEVRMLRDPSADPNEVWTALTRQYLHIRPHPELSWWAMRGQLIDAPGYMMNYAAGAILIAAIRARTTEIHGPFVQGDSTWYSWVSSHLYRFGLERPTRDVVQEFLGSQVSPDAIIADMERMRK